MFSTDEFVLRQLLSWHDQGLQCWLNMIISATGSSPRPVGSLMACNARGELAGSLSGGCVEDDFIERIGNGDLAQDRPAISQYGVSAAENERLGLPCGGRLRVLAEPFAPGTRRIDDIRAVLSAIQQRSCLLRTIALPDGDTSLETLQRARPLVASEDSVSRSFGPVMRMLLIGAGHMSRVLAELALAMDYHVMVCDPREHMRAQWTLDEVPLLTGMPDDAVREHACDPHSLVITLTHDPRFDDMALMEALTHPLFFVGALGSLRTTAKRLERLRQLGISEEQLQRLHAPVGLDIGSKSPMEIAVSVLAQITALRRPGKP